MNRVLIAATLSLTLAACASGQGRARGPLKPVANPSTVIAAELAFARLAQEKGQWAAFRATAAKDAEMFVPQRVKAADWLKGRAEPAVAVKWQPHAVWSSCDGSFAVTRGAWTSANGAGHFATVWQRQKDGSYKWLADMSLATERVQAAPEMVAATVADCQTDDAAAVAVAIVGEEKSDVQTRSATDGTLTWSTIVRLDGTRVITLHIWKNGDLQQAFSESSTSGPR
jgi:hypothetical protein